MVKNKLNDILKFGTGILVLSFLLLLSYFTFIKFDLTADKRFTLSDQTIELIEKLDDVVEFKIYLEGEHIPSELARVKKSLLETLEEFKSFSGDNIEFEFIDLLETIEDPDELNKELYRIQQVGVTILPIPFTNEKNQQDRFNLPLGGEVFYKGNFVALPLIKGSKGSDTKTYQKAIESIEYELSNALRKLVNPISKQVAFLQGHSELQRFELQDLSISLFEYYKTGPVWIKDETGNEQLNALATIDLLIIAKPQDEITQKEQFIIDQYIMNGGKTLWMLDGVAGAELDSLQYSEIILATPLNTGIESLLYKYGVKINTDVVEDLQCSKIPIQVTANGDGSDFQLTPWIYNPILSTNSNHLITKNLDPVKLEFASTLDTIPVPGVKHTVLYKTSGKNRYKKSPSRIGFGETVAGIKTELFKAPEKPVALLLEGTFPSYFANRISPEFQKNPDFKMKQESDFNKMIIISDGDIAKNWFTSQEEMIPIGKDKFMDYFFDNKKFVMNAVNYLLDDQDYISIRSKNVQMRLLNEKKIKENKSMIQILNIVVPSGFIILLSIIFFFLRKYKYAK